MTIFDIFALVLLAVLLFWTIYNGSIIYVGIRSKRKRNEQAKDTENIQLPKFSIIVPTKDDESVVDRCLKSIIDLDYPRDKLEVIVVDGNSQDGTLGICREYAERFPQIFKLISEKESKGKPAALNLSLSCATGDIVGVFDADSLPERNSLTKVAAYFDDKKVTAVQGRTTSLNEKKNFLTRIVSMEEKAWFQALLTGREKLHLFVPLNGSCQFVRRVVLEEMGGWAESSLTEDVELALRLVEKKYEIRYADDVCSGQETPNTLGDLVQQRVRWYRGYMETALKYGRLLNRINKRTVDAEISLAGPFIMVVSLVSYFNWLIFVLFLAETNIILELTGLVMALTAISLLSIGVVLLASERPVRLRNLVWIPFILVYWLVQISIAGLAFLKIVFRRKRVWSKTAKKGFTTTNLNIS